jgi:glycosyltransferase involved in cell wall biosynthesis
MRKQFIKRASGFIAYGSKAKEYLVSMGADAAKVFIGINTVDTSFYAEQTNELRKNLPPSPLKHLTYIGYLSERKKVIQLLYVVKLLAEMRTDFVLDLIGDGDTKQELMDYVSREKLDRFVRFHGFLQKEQLPEHLACSQCFLFQTGFDIWGLVLNEAMAAGVPCIASPNAGSTFDLITEGETGFSMYFENAVEVSNKINELLNNSEKTLEMGRKAALFIMNNASVKISAFGFVNAIEK